MLSGFELLHCKENLAWSNFHSSQDKTKNRKRRETGRQGLQRGFDWLGHVIAGAKRGSCSLRSIQYFYSRLDNLCALCKTLVKGSSAVELNKPFRDYIDFAGTRISFGKSGEGEV